MLSIQDVKVLESIRRRATKLDKGLEGLSCEERLRAPGCSRLEERRPRGDLAALCSFPRRCRSLPLGTDGRMCGKGTELCQGQTGHRENSLDYEGGQGLEEASLQGG